MDVALRPPTIPRTFEMSGKKMDTEQLTTKNIIVAMTFSFVEYSVLLKNVTKNCCLKGT